MARKRNIGMIGKYDYESSQIKWKKGKMHATYYENLSDTEIVEWFLNKLEETLGGIMKGTMLD